MKADKDEEIHGPFIKARLPEITFDENGDACLRVFGEDGELVFSVDKTGIKDENGEEMLAPSNDGWISVEDRLPEIGLDDVSDDVLIAVQYGDDSLDNQIVVCVGYLLDDYGDGNLSWWAMMPHNCDSVGGPDKKFESEQRDRVTHWMPLPKPPKEDE